MIQDQLDPLERTESPERKARLDHKELKVPPEFKVFKVSQDQQANKVNKVSLAPRVPQAPLVPPDAKVPLDKVK